MYLLEDKFFSTQCFRDSYFPFIILPHNSLPIISPEVGLSFHDRIFKYFKVVHYVLTDTLTNHTLQVRGHSEIRTPCLLISKQT